MLQNKPIATNTIYSDTPTIDGGEIYAQIFVGTKTLLTDIYGMKSSACSMRRSKDRRSVRMYEWWVWTSSELT